MYFINPARLFQNIKEQRHHYFPKICRLPLLLQNTSTPIDTIMKRNCDLSIKFRCNFDNIGAMEHVLDRICPESLPHNFSYLRPRHYFHFPDGTKSLNST